MLGHAAARRLFAVTQGRVEEMNAAWEMDGVWGHRHHLGNKDLTHKSAKMRDIIQIYNFY
jgi:hypothetical protein